METYKRVFVIVLDSLGIGAMPDSEEFGDKGVDTFGHILDKMGKLDIPNLQKLGMLNLHKDSLRRRNCPGQHRHPAVPEHGRFPAVHHSSKGLLRKGRPAAGGLRHGESVPGTVGMNLTFTS